MDGATNVYSKVFTFSFESPSFAESAASLMIRIAVSVPTATSNHSASVPLSAS
jgi:hypothetical protein